MAVATMTAIVHDDYGAVPEDVLRLVEVDKPTIADDQVLVRVRAASVDRGTWPIMAGLPYPIWLAGLGSAGRGTSTRGGVCPERSKQWAAT